MKQRLNKRFIGFHRFPHPITSTLLGVTLLTAVFTTSCSQPESVTATAPPPTPIDIKKLSSSTVNQTSNFVGSLEAAEKVEVKPEIQGRIEAVNVKDGDRVQPGTVIMELKPDQTVPQYQAAQANVSAATAARNTAQQQMQVAQAQLATAQSDLQLAQTNDNRAKYLVTQGAIGQYTADQAANQLATARNKVKAAQDQVNAAKAAIGQAEAMVRQAQAQAGAAQVSVSFKQIVAPISGVIGDLPLRLGDYVTVGQTVATVTQNNPLDLRISVPSNRANQLRIGLPVELMDPNTKNKLVTGSVSFISPRVNANEQSILIKARFPNSNGLLRDGQYVQANVIWDSAPGLLIPTTSVTRIGSQSFVYVVEQSQSETGQAQTIVRQRPVKLGSMQGQNYQVLEGLKAGEQVATSNILKLRDQAPVQIVAAPTSTPAPAANP